MSQQEYQRRFAMLRPFGPLHSPMAGFARFEVRGGRGWVTVSVQGVRPGTPPLYAALIGGSESQVAVCACGQLAQTKSGQGSLRFEFDPRNVGGVPFDRCHTCVVTANGPEQAQVLLCGVFGKTEAPADWTVRERALHALWYEPDPLAPETETVEPEPKRTPSKEESAAPEIPPVTVTEKTPKEISEETPETVLCAGADEDASAPEEPRLREHPVSLDAFRWEGHAYGLRPLFEKYPEEPVFEDREDVFFVRIPIAVQTPVDHYLLGAHVRQERVDAICIAVPGPYAPEAPAGLMGAVFAQSQGGTGYWFFWQDGYTGRPLDLPWPWETPSQA